MQSKDSSQKKSLFSRLFRAETPICCIGIACIVYGVINGLKVMPFFFGACIVTGSIALHFIRKKDWDAHWAEHERIKAAYEQRMADEREKKE